MNRINIIYLVVLILFTGCRKDDPYINVSKQEIATYNYKAYANIDISSNTSWTVSSNSSWCRPNKSKGNGNDKLILTIEENTMAENREATLFINIGTDFKTVIITQNVNGVNANGIGIGKEYEIPVIFHVLYNDENNKFQYVEKGHIPMLLSRASELFNKKLDMNVVFVAATTNENNEILSEPGVNRIKVDNHINDYEKFMIRDNNFGIETSWNLNKYVNIFLYEFCPINNAHITGASHHPYTIEINPLAGLHNGDVYFGMDKPSHYAHCISLNNKIIYEVYDYGQHSTTNVVVTLTHELGHYFGLNHTFSYDEKYESDYCDDTPNYNRKEYVEWMIKFMGNNQEYEYETLFQRASTDGKSFISTNIMDYDYSYRNEFTEDQRDRVRHVLMYSPLIPGPKITKGLPRSKSSVIPPIRFSE